MLKAQAKVNSERRTKEKNNGWKSEKLYFANQRSKKLSESLKENFTSLITE